MGEKKTDFTRLSKQGFSINKSENNKEIIANCKKELTVKPNINTDYGGQAKPFPVYRESQNRLYLPRHYGQKKFGNASIDIWPESENIDLEFNGKLREVQNKIVNIFLEKAALTGGGLICLHCGGGKTVIAINLISCLKKKTIVVVHKEFLVNQWIERIEQFLPDARIGKIQGPVFDIENKDIVIAMLQSLSMKEFPKDAFDSFGFAVADECHHLSAEVFSRSLPKIASEYTLGLSATPKRKDGLSKVFEWYLGPILYKQKKEEIDNVEVKTVYINSKDKNYGNEIRNYKGTLNIAAMLNYIAELEDRNNQIIDELKLIIKNKNRKVLILSERRIQLEIIKNKVLEQDICTVGFYVGGMKQKDLKESETKQLMLATYNMASEAMDVPMLNTLLMITSKSDIEQSVGRVLRQKKEDRLVEPLIIDFVDNYSIFFRQYQKRKKFYLKNGYVLVNEPDNKEKTNDKLTEIEECLI